MWASATHFTGDALVRRLRSICRARLAARPKSCGRHGYHRPRSTGWQCAIFDESCLARKQLQRAAVREHDGLFVLNEVQGAEVFLLELAEVGRQRSDAVLVAPTVVVADSPRDLSCPPCFVRWRVVVRQRLEHLRSNISMLCVDGLCVVTSLRALMPRE